MDHHQRIFVLTLVVGASLLAYPAVVVLTALNLNQRDPLYYEKIYESNYMLSSDGEDIANINFKSEVISEDQSAANIEILGSSQQSLVNIHGEWLNGSDEDEATPYSLIFWFFIENPIQKAVAGEKNTQSPEEIPLIDPFGLFGEINTTFTLVFERFYIETFREFSTQVSNYYAVYDDSTGLKIGYALYDTTCGLLWWFDVINLATQKNVRIDLQDTSFPISRNRFYFTGVMLVNFAIAALIFLIVSKRKHYSKEDVNSMAKLIFIGNLAFFIDGILDIWYTKYLSGLIVTHFLFVGLMIICFPKNWRASLIILIEIAMCGVMLEFNGIVDLVLTFGVCNIGAFIGLMSIIFREVEFEIHPKAS